MNQSYTALNWDDYHYDNIPLELLVDAARNIHSLGLVHNTWLQRGTRQIDPAQIPWADIHYLYVQGDLVSDVRWGECIWDPGVYINKAENWLLIVLEKDAPDPTQSIIDRLGPKLKYLSIQRTGLRGHEQSALPRLSVEHLIGLDELVLRENHKLKDVDGLDKLLKLKRLGARDCPELRSLAGLDSLSNLEELNIVSCHSLSMLPSLNQLTRLNSLSLCSCSNLVSLSGLEKLSQLSFLTLRGCSKLSLLPELRNLALLPHLNLGGCRSLNLPPNFTFPPNIKALCLDHTPIARLPGTIRNLKSLRNLDLQNMHLTELPDWLPEIAEGFSLKWRAVEDGIDKAIVYLDGTTVDGVDMSIFEQPYEMVVKWFEERKAGRTQALNEMKVIFLGDGEAGKSYTISRLMNNGGDPLDYEKKRTPGIAIKNHPCNFNGRDFRVNYWDFGGQEILHAMHRIFLTNRTMYVVLVSVKDDDYQERAEYWLRNIKSFAPDAPVLLAFNKIDMRPRLFLDKTVLHAANGNLKQIVSMSALEFDQEKFDSEFRSILLQEIVNTKMLDVEWPKSWIELKNKMENLGKYYITLEDYEEICADCHVDDVQAELLDWFNDLGVSFCCRNNFRLENQVILEPRWITNGLYIILFNQCEDIVNGMIPHRYIHDLLKRSPKDTSVLCTDRKARYRIPGDAEYVLGIMRQFGLSLQIVGDREFIPMLCQPQSPLDLAAYESNEDVLEFHMDFQYLPNNVLHQLMVEQYSELDIENVWRAGARFQQPGTGLSAIVAMDENTLKFFISHSDSRHAPQTYLTVLKAKIDQIWRQMGLQEPEEAFVYKTAGSRETVGYEELKHSLKKGDDELYARSLRRSIPISDLLRQFGLEELAEHEHPPLRNRRISCPNKRTSPIDEWKLLEYIVESCQKIQADPIYGATGDKSGKEDERNRRIRDDLEYRLKNTGYRISDQPQQGRSGTGQGVGELDLLLKDEQGRLWTIIEALRVHNIDKIEWKKHLTKLLGNYNYGGLHFAYLLTYVDSNAADFMKIWGNYQRYIPTYDPGEYSVDPNSFQPLNAAQDLQYIQTAMCRYTCGSAQVTVYHLFVMVRPQPPKTDSIPKSSVK